MHKNCFLIFALICSISGTKLNTYRLELILDALHDGLQYVGDHINQVNLDAVFTTRNIKEQLEAFLQFEPEVFRTIRTRVKNLKDKASNITDIGRLYIESQGGRYAEEVGELLGRSKRLLWLPSRDIRQDYVVSPIPCSNYYYDWDLNDHCFGQIAGNRHQKPCEISDLCIKTYSAPKKRGYYLTHQLLFWELVEMGDCKHNISQDLVTYLCSNIMRDAKKIAAAEFPESHRDIFLEQIGLCGMWGFRDFHKPEWLKRILQWQNPSGCFASNTYAFWECKDDLVPDGKRRVKREEKILDDGCLSHTTGVGLIALATSVRFEAERIHHQNIA